MSFNHEMFLTGSRYRSARSLSWAGPAWVTFLILLLCSGTACSPGEKEFTFVVRDMETRPVSGVEIRLAGEDRKLGATDGNGQLLVRLRPAKSGNLRFRLSEAKKADAPRYRFEVVEVDAAALQSTSKTIWLEAAQPAQADSAAPILLRVTSEPSGAHAFLDGEDRGPTPVSLRDVAPGRHQIEVRMPGRQPYTQEVVLEPGEVTIPADLPRLEDAKATLRVTSSPAGAQIVLDGHATGQTAPATLSGLAPGRHTLRLQLDGYEAFQTAVDLSAGGPGGSAGGTLQRLGSSAADHDQDGTRSAGAGPASGFSREYLVGTSPGYAEVYLDGQSSNRNAMGRFKVTLSAGRHTFHVLNSKAGVDVSFQFEVKPGDSNKRLVLNYATGAVEARP